jgi:SDR family mycofactocin-dependent oxidoreductase
MGKLDGQVAFITGAARGRGRSHAVRFAEEGADIIAVDICSPITSSVGAPATPEDLAETVAQVEAHDRRIVASKVDIRDYEALRAALDDGVAALGRLDVVCANAGMWNYGRVHEFDEATWQEVIDINLTGAWHTAKAAVPHLIAGGRGGSIVFTSSVAGLRGYENTGHYVAAKHGVVGLMRTLALELAPQMIRVNTVHPSNVDTLMIHNEETYRLFRPDLAEPTFEDAMDVFETMNAMPVRWLEPQDITNAVLFLACADSRYITGATLPVDAGFALK